MSLSRSRATHPWAVALTSAVLILLALVLPASGRAAVPITGFYAGPVTADSDCYYTGQLMTASTQAGSRPDYCVAFALDTPADDDLKGQVVDTPLGFAGDTTGRPQCTAAQFGADNSNNVTCPAAAQIGDAYTDLTVDTNAGTDLELEGVPGRAFNLVPGDDELALIGLVLDPPTQPHVKILIRITLRPAPDVGLRAVIDDIPREVCLTYASVFACDHAIALHTFALRFWGSNVDHPSMPAPFALLGSDCTSPQVTKLSATSYAGGTASADASYQLTECDRTPFAPTLSVTTAEPRADVPTEATMKVGFGAGTPTNIASPPKTTVVTLPAGLTLAAQVASGADGLPVCSSADFGPTTTAAATCPAASAIGTVSIKSPLVDRTLTGKAYVGQQPAAGSLPRLYLEAAVSASADAPRVKLVGTLSTDDQHRLVATLDDLPQVPTSEVAITFRGGNNAPLVTPTTCGTWDGSIAGTPWNGNAAVTASAPYSIAEDCGLLYTFGGSVAFGSTTPTALGTGTFVTSLSRPDRSQRWRRVSVDLPSGQVANLKGVPECSQEAALAGTCDESTRVGSVTALSGVGPEPYKITGAAYLTARPAGAVAGLAIHTAVKIGDIDLGSLDVLARIEIREDLGLRIVADVPLTFKGLPLDLRGLDVALDRPGFPLNPSSCEPLSGSATFYGEQSGQAQGFGAYQVSGCGAIPFAPTLDAAVTGETKSKGRPTITMQISNAAGSAALKSTAVTLPLGVGVDLVQIPRACPQDTFRAGGCPENARIGTLGGNLSIADEALTGYVYLLKPAAGSVLPGLGLQFEGRFAGRVVGSNAVDSKSGRIVARFPSIPDLPLTSLRIQINGGTGGPLIATDELCTSAVAVDASFGGQNGASVVRNQSTVCGAALGSRIPKFSVAMSGLRKGRPSLRLKTGAGVTRAISRVDLTLPSGWSLRSQKGISDSRYAKLSKLSAKGSTDVKRLSSRKLRLTMPSAGSTSFYLLTRSRTISVSKSADRKTKDNVVVTARITFKDGGTVSVPVAVKPK
ncbi:MAG: hypothetical protein J7513_06055 [Solirubrobacteraceae bacterium]|nr:hypothetical protein [Solirubrobacteraceae bacterium]